jgi:phenylacetate-CoA ligase
MSRGEWQNGEKRAHLLLCAEPLWLARVLQHRVWGTSLRAMVGDHPPGIGLRYAREKPVLPARKCAIIHRFEPEMLAAPESITEKTSRLAEALPRWLSEKPIYQGATADGPCSTGSFLRLPLITKEDIRRDFPRNFLGEDTDVESLLEQNLVELEHTSGTSEARTPLLLPRGWWAEQELRALRLNRVVASTLDEQPEAHRVTITSPVCSSDIRFSGVPSRDERIVGNSLFISLSRYPWLWGQTDLARMVEETLDWEPRFLDVDPVYGVAFALHCERHGLRFPGLNFIICSYEFVSVTHRRILERAFGVPVFDLYGSTETGHLLMEDERGEMRPSPETAFLEIINPAADGVGELVVTTLTNDYMPLIRYRIGDLVEREEKSGDHSYVVHGRTIDSVTTRSGRRVTTWQIDQCFAGMAGIAHYQLLERADGWLFRFLADLARPSAKQLTALKRKLGELLEHSHIRLEPTDLIAPEKSGKFRLVTPLRRTTQPGSTS